MWALCMQQGVCFCDVPKLSAGIIHVKECEHIDLNVAKAICMDPLRRECK